MNSRSFYQPKASADCLWLIPLVLLPLPPPAEESSTLSTTSLNSENLPNMVEKLPDKTDFPRNVEVEPSDKIKNRKLKKVSKFNFILISDSCGIIHGTKKNSFNS